MRPIPLSLLLVTFVCQGLNGLAITPITSIRQQRPRACPLPRLQNGGYKLVRQGKMLKFRCNPGYQMIGDKINECVANRWDLDIPICIKPGCPLLNIPINGILQYMHMSASAVLFCNQNYQIAGSAMSYCNGTHWDRAIGSCRALNTTFTPFCDFESENICGWFHDTEDDFDFTRANGHNNRTVRILTGPQADHTIGKPLEGHYMVINTKSQSYMKKARLISPVFNASWSHDTCLRFYYHMYGQSVGSLRAYIAPLNVPLSEVIVHDDQEYARSYLVFEQAGSKSNEWHEGIVRIAKVTSEFQIIFEAICGQTRLSDIAIDDFTILTKQECDSDPITTTDILLKNVVTEESVLTIQSCANRCDEAAPVKRGRGAINQEAQCDCDDACNDFATCCLDFADFCDDAIKPSPTSVVDLDDMITIKPGPSDVDDIFTGVPERKIMIVDIPDVISPRSVVHWRIMIFTLVAILTSALVTFCARHAIRQYKIATDPMNYKNKMDNMKIAAAPECSEVRYLTGGEDVELDFSLATPDTVMPEIEV